MFLCPESGMRFMSCRVGFPTGAVSCHQLSFSQLSMQQQGMLYGPDAVGVVLAGNIFKNPRENVEKCRKQALTCGNHGDPVGLVISGWPTSIWSWRRIPSWNVRQPRTLCLLLTDFKLWCDSWRALQMTCRPYTSFGQVMIFYSKDISFWIEDSF